MKNRGTRKCLRQYSEGPTIAVRGDLCAGSHSLDHSLKNPICLPTLFPYAYPSQFVDLNVLAVESTRDTMAPRPSVFDYFGLMFYFEWVARPVHVMD